MADSTAEAKQIAMDTEVDTIVSGPGVTEKDLPADASEAAESPSEAVEEAASAPAQSEPGEAAREAPAGQGEVPAAQGEVPAAQGEAPAGQEERIAALEKALEEMRAERVKAEKAAEEARRAKALTDAGLSEDYAVFLDGDPDTWEQRLSLLTGLKGAAEKKPVSVPRDPVMSSDTISKNNLQEQAAGFFGLL